MQLTDRIARGIIDIALAFVILASQPVAGSAQNGDASVGAAVRGPVRVDGLGDPLPERALLRLGTKRFQHPSGPSQIILSVDESIVVSVDEDDLIAWDSTSGKQLWRDRMEFEGGVRVSAAGYGIRPLAIMPDDGKLATPAARGSIAFWDVASGESTLVKVDMPAAPKSIDVRTDGKLLALGTNRLLLVCDRAGKEVFRKENPDQPLARPADDGDRMTFGGDFSYGIFSPDGKLLALVNSSNPTTIQLFEATTGNVVRDIEGTDRIVRMAFSPNSKQLATTERDVSARLYDVQSGKRLWEYMIVPPNAAESYTSGIAFRPDAKQIAVGAPIGSDYRIRLLDAKSGKETGFLVGSQWKPWTLQYRSDSRVLYGSGWDGVIRRWDMDTNQQMPLPGAVRASAVCAMSRDGKHMAFADDTESVHIVDVKTGETLKEFVEAGVGWGQVVFSYDGNRLAAGGSSDLDVHVIVWDLDTQATLHHWSWNKGQDTHSGVEALSFSRNGARIAAAVFRQDAAYVWDLPSDQQVAKVTHVDVYGLDIDSSGRTIVTGGWDKTIRVWDCDTSVELNSLTVEDDVNGAKDTRMYGVKLSNDQSMIATVDMTGTIRFYDRALNPISKIQNAGWFTFGALQFSRNDLWLGVGSRQGVEVYDVESGAKLWAANDHEEYIYTVDFGARDRTILSGGTDGVCYLWDLQSNAPGHTADNDAIDYETLYQELIGSDDVKSFAAYQRLRQSPERALELLSGRLSKIAGREIISADVSKWIVALGADDQAIVTMATNQLIALGPGVCDRLSDAMESKTLSETKRKRIEQVRRTIISSYRRATAIVAELDSPSADTALSDLLMKARSTEFKAILNKAQLRREQSMSR